MKLQAIRNVDEIKLVGIVAEMDVQSSSIERLVLRDTEDNILVITLKYGCLNVCIPEPPKKVEKHQVSGFLDRPKKFPFGPEIFSAFADALDRKAEVSETFPAGDFAITQIEVEE